MAVHVMVWLAFCTYMCVETDSHLYIHHESAPYIIRMRYQVLWMWMRCGADPRISAAKEAKERKEELEEEGKEAETVKEEKEAEERTPSVCSTPSISLFVLLLNLYRSFHSLLHFPLLLASFRSSVLNYFTFD